MPAWQACLEQSRRRFVDEMIQFLSIPSVSSLSEHAGDVRRAAEWVAGRLRSAGMDNVETLETGGHPSVYGEWLGAPGKPTVLIYGHFDTQPVDPEHLWTNPPFEPTIRDERVYARGSSDDKGNMLIPILALEAMLEAQGSLPINVKLLFEGEEEIGSPNMETLIREQRSRLTCDLVLSADGTQSSEERPSLLIGFKGLCAMQVDVTGPGMDLHSGIYGGAVQNPIHALADVLSSMHSADGRVLVDGFYDNVTPLTAGERALIDAVPYDEVTFKKQLGVKELFGEPGLQHV